MSLRLLNRVLYTAVVLSICPAVSSADDSARLLKQYGEISLAVASTPDAEAVSRLLERMDDEGKWPDIRYNDPGRTSWSGGQHFIRLYSLSRAFRTADHRYHLSSDLAGKVDRAVQYWLKTDPKCVNWWYNDIHVPQNMAPVLVLMGEHLPESTRQAAIAYLNRKPTHPLSEMTGANLMWRAEIMLVHGALSGDDASITDAADRINREITITTGEGVQPDFSFHQHGPRLQSGHYGESYTHRAIRLAMVVSGTRWALPQAKYELLADHILRGQQWFVYNGRWSPISQDRAVSRRRGAPKDLAVSIRMLAGHSELDAQRREALLAAATRIETPGDASPLLGHRFFPRSDAAVHRAPGWYASLRMTSSRTYPTEVGLNNENLLGHFLADGVLFLQQKGDEYERLFPVMDFRKLPGLTTILRDALPENFDPKHRMASSFVGGATDGQVGIASADFRSEAAPITARQSWIFTPTGIICLGADIRSDAAEPAITTLNQTQLRGDVLVESAGNRQSISGTATLPAVHAIHHDNVTYAFFDPATVHLSAREQTGSWKRINDFQSDTPITENVFTAWLDHGASPDGAAYAYAVLPGVSADDLRSKPLAERFRILRNDAAAQSVVDLHTGDTYVAFFEAGSVDTPAGTRVKVSAPCVLLARPAAGGVLSVSLADPTGQLDQIDVEIDGNSIPVSLPRDFAAGSTTTFTRPSR